MIIIFIYIIGGKQDHDTRVENDCRDQADNEQTYDCYRQVDNGHKGHHRQVARPD